MVSTWKTDGTELVLTQRFISGRAYTLIGIFGIILLIIGLIGFLSELHTLSSGPLLSIKTFTTTLLIFQFLFTLGLAMISIRFSSRSLRNYYEAIAFDSARESVTFTSPETGDEPYVFNYTSLANLLLDLYSGGPDYPDMYNIYAVKKDGAVFWITGFSNDKKRVSEFLDTLSAHTGLAVTDKSGLGLDRDAVKTYPAGTGMRSALASRFVMHTSAARGDIFTLRREKHTIPHLILGIILYGFFFSVPFYILNNFIFAPIPLIARFMGWVFIALWMCILLGTMLLSMKEYSIIARGEGLTVEVCSRMLPFMKGSIDVPTGMITGIRTNRIEDGACSLSLVVDASFIAARKGLATIMNLSVHKRRPWSLTVRAGSRELDLWVLPAHTSAAIGPGLPDLIHMEDRLKNILAIK